MILVYIVVGIVLLFLVLSMMGPKDYAVSRSIDVDRARGEVYDYLRHIKNQNDWGPWARRDPSMEQSFSGTDGEVGFVSHWKGNKEVGEGEQEITGLTPGERIETDLRFIKPFKAESDAYFELEDSGAGTRVTWGIVGENKSAISRVMGLFMSMDKMIGKDFEEGLGTLKSTLEGSA